MVRGFKLGTQAYGGVEESSFESVVCIRGVHADTECWRLRLVDEPLVWHKLRKEGRSIVLEECIKPQTQQTVRLKVES